MSDTPMSRWSRFFMVLPSGTFWKVAPDDAGGCSSASGWEQFEEQLDKITDGTSSTRMAEHAGVKHLLIHDCQGSTETGRRPQCCPVPVDARHIPAS
jgi:hypothetical protein